MLKKFKEKTVKKLFMSASNVEAKLKDNSGESGIGIILGIAAAVFVMVIILKWFDVNVADFLDKCLAKINSVLNF